MTDHRTMEVMSATRWENDRIVTVVVDVEDNKLAWSSRWVGKRNVLGSRADRLDIYAEQHRTLPPRVYGDEGTQQCVIVG